MDDRTYQQALDEARPGFEALQLWCVAVADQIQAAWLDIAPFLRAWIAEADTLTDQQWMDEAESTRQFYDRMKAHLAAVDAASGVPMEPRGRDDVD